ncbi:MAG: FRG domain-containing protein [Anaerolineae bacterium]|nr:FRG domain-containing protein [Anaerolineae bacterium]
MGKIATTPNDIRVNSWAELNDAVFKESWDESLNRIRSPYVFRGCAEIYDLTTSLIRLGGMFDKLEPVILRNFRQFAFGEVSPGDSDWSWLAVAQHHGLPTRLLDWSNSPLVAAHFATVEMGKYDRDGCIWCVHLDYVRSKQPQQLYAMMRDKWAKLYSVEMIHQVASSLAEFDQLTPIPFPVFFNPPALDQRIINQFAIFSMMSSPTARLDEWLLEHPESYFRIIIPASLKWEVRDRLDQVNITERVLFPGLDGLSQWLKRYYSPRK